MRDVQCQSKYDNQMISLDTDGLSAALQVFKQAQNPLMQHQILLNDLQYTA